MKQRARIPRKAKKRKRRRPELFHKPERDRRFLDPRSFVTKGGRVRLFGADYVGLQILAHRRAGGTQFAICECGCQREAPWAVLTDYWIPLEAKGELSHNEHGARKSDELSRVRWLRHECHVKSHNCNGKPVSKKAVA